jgi:hypothetical protein
MAKSERKSATRKDNENVDDEFTVKDPRFQSIHNDPRFVRPRRKDTRVEIDERFAHVLGNEDFDIVRKLV